MREVSLRLASILAIGFMLVGCATTPDSRRIFIDPDTYKRILSDYTEKSQAYEGLINVIDIRTTLLNTPVREAQSLRKATAFQWSDKELQADRDYNTKSMASETKVFLSFFTPETKDDNLSKSDTVWRVFLDNDGKRYAGTITKMTDTPSEISDLYPDHTRWGTPYIVKFLVSTRMVEEKPSRMTITGPIGSTNVDFKALAK